jgi:glycosyltransferase involved in cell wall biosynthesis
MRVLHVLPSIAQAYGGPTRSLAGFCRASTHAGIDVEIAAPRPSDADVDWLKVETGGIPMRLFASAGQGASVISPRLVSGVSRSTREYDVVHVHGLLNLVSSVAARITRARSTPLVIRPFGMLSRYTYTHRRRWLKQLFHTTLDRPNLVRADAFHFTTEAEEDGAGWLGMELTDRSFVIPPPIAATGALGREPSSERLTVVCISRIAPVKNLESLLDAWPRV